MKSKTGSGHGAASGTHTHPVSTRNGLAADAIAAAVLDNLRFVQGKLPRHATRNDWYMALAYAVRDRVLDRCLTTVEAISQTDTATKLVAYLSAEFLTGPHLGNSLVNLGIWDGRAGCAVDARAGSRRAAGAGRGAGARQWRPRPAGGLLHGFARDAERSRHRLRHPLRVRHLRSGHSRRLAGRAHRQVAALRQPLGDRAVGSHV